MVSAMLFVPTVRHRKAAPGRPSVVRDWTFPSSTPSSARPTTATCCSASSRGRLDPPVRVIICTNAFGMGLDLPRRPAAWFTGSILRRWKTTCRNSDAPVGMASLRSLSCSPETRTQGLLRFMAEEACRVAGVDVASKASALEAKLPSRRTKMRRIATSRGACATRRRCDSRYFGEGRFGLGTRRASHVRVAEWVLLRSAHVPHEPASVADRCRSRECRTTSSNWVAGVSCADAVVESSPRLLRGRGRTLDFVGPRLEAHRMVDRNPAALADRLLAFGLRTPAPPCRALLLASLEGGEATSARRHGMPSYSAARRGARRRGKLAGMPAAEVFAEKIEAPAWRR